MNNKQIIKNAQAIYNPNLAFGDKYLIGLLKQIKVPNDDGNFEVVGSSVVRTIGVRWECANCGNYNRNEVIEIYHGCEDIETQCKKCKAKHLVEVN